MCIISALHEKLSAFLAQKYGFDSGACERIIVNYLEYLRDDLTVFIEYPYVDKVFRDSYYHYFSSKHWPYQRDSVRLSFFEGHVSGDHFLSFNLWPQLKDSFLGVIIIRPTFPKLFGRTTLSPKAFKSRDFVVCLTSKSCSISGHKLDISAFPHASQDGEHLTCAETAIWSILEYFGHKYPEYKPVLPSEIISALSDPAIERVVPSRGLSITQISFALKQFGFAPRIYTIDAYKEREPDFKRLLSWYVESGIPIIATLENERVGHAVLLIGHKNFVGDYYNDKDMDKLHLQIIDTADFDKKYIVIDDNYPPYQICSFSNPTHYYDDPKFQGMFIKAFVVPLYERIYLEPLEAHRLSLEILQRIMGVQPGPGEDLILTRFYLTSSRSYKNWILYCYELHSDLKNIILATPMPKFIWITEISNSRLFKKDMISGMIIIDATGNATSDSFLFGFNDGKAFMKFNNSFQVISANFNTELSCYRNNLKGGWSQWKA